MKNLFKIGLVTASIAALTACGGGGDVIIVEDHNHGFLSVDNLNTANGVVCVEDIFLEANSAQGQKVARDLIDYYGTYDYGLNPIHQAYSAPTYCGGATANYVPSPGVIISASHYYNVIAPLYR